MKHVKTTRFDDWQNGYDELNRRLQSCLEAEDVSVLKGNLIAACHFGNSAEKTQRQINALIASCPYKIKTD